MVPGIDPKVDYVFKKLFGTESSIPLLLSLLNAVLKPPPDHRLIALEIIDPYNDKETPDDKLSIVDVKARDQAGGLYNIEMQMQGTPVYPDRALYYWAVLYGGQLREGQDYSTLRSTISISILNDVLFPQVPDYHLDFQLRSQQHPNLVFSPMQSMHVIELPKFGRSAAELADSLEAWCYFLINGAALDTNDLPKTLDEPEVRKAMEVLEIMSKNDVEWERYQSRLKLQRDNNMYYDAARQKGRAEGREEGREEGIILGVIDRINLCERFFNLQQTPRDQLLALSLADLNAMAISLEQRLNVSQDR